jgi:hypothetical protein
VLAGYFRNRCAQESSLLPVSEHGVLVEDGSLSRKDDEMIGGAFLGLFVLRR